MKSDWKRQERVRAAKKKLCTRYGVFVWNRDGRYPRRAAVGKLHRSEKLAQRQADRRPGENLVVRSVEVCDPTTIHVGTLEGRRRRR